MLKHKKIIRVKREMVETHNIENQQTSDDESVPEHQNYTSAGRPRRSTTGKVVDRLDMIFNGKFYDNVQFTSIGENKEREWSHDCLRITTNVMFTQFQRRK